MQTTQGVMSTSRGACLCVYQASNAIKRFLNEDDADGDASDDDMPAFVTDFESD